MPSVCPQGTAFASPSTEPLAGNYFVSAYPPSSEWHTRYADPVEQVLTLPAAGDPVGLYVHIPFCAKKCDYCYAISFEDKKAAERQSYLDNLLTELHLYAQQPFVQGRPLSFIHYGGGTPSILTPEQVVALGQGLAHLLPWTEVSDVTFECAPKSVQRDKLEAMKQIGVTRVSMGVQSFDDGLLRLNGRIHLSADAIRAYRLIQEAAFDWINLDLMVGLLGENWELWQDSVKQIIQLGPDSVTIYQMEIPYHSRTYRDLKAGCLSAEPVEWQLKRARLDYAFRELEQAGYTVVSGYMAAKDPARHQFQYQEVLWGGGDLLGLGVSSFSYLGGIHFQNSTSWPDYQACLEQQQLPIERARLLTEWERLLREFILQLKWGEVNIAEFRAKFGANVLNVLAQPLCQMADEGWLQILPNTIRLTRAGLLRVDRLLPRLFLPEQET